MTLYYPLSTFSTLFFFPDICLLPLYPYDFFLFFSKVNASSHRYFVFKIAAIMSNQLAMPHSHLPSLLALKVLSVSLLWDSLVPTTVLNKCGVSDQALSHHLFSANWPNFNTVPKEAPLINAESCTSLWVQRNICHRQFKCISICPNISSCIHYGVMTSLTMSIWAVLWFQVYNTICGRALKSRSDWLLQVYPPVYQLIHFYRQVSVRAHIICICRSLWMVILLFQHSRLLIFLTFISINLAFHEYLLPNFFPPTKANVYFIGT